MDCPALTRYDRIKQECTHHWLCGVTHFDWHKMIATTPARCRLCGRETVISGPMHEESYDARMSGEFGYEVKVSERRRKMVKKKVAA